MSKRCNVALEPLRSSFFFVLPLLSLGGITFSVYAEPKFVVCTFSPCPVLSFPQALLKGLSSILFFQSPTRPTEDDITYDFLHSEVFRSSSLDTPQQRQVMDGVELLLRHAADNDMSSEQLQDFLAGTRLTKGTSCCLSRSAVVHSSSSSLLALFCLGDFGFAGWQC